MKMVVPFENHAEKLVKALCERGYKASYRQEHHGFRVVSGARQNYVNRLYQAQKMEAFL